MAVVGRGAGQLFFLMQSQLAAEQLVVGRIEAHCGLFEQGGGELGGGALSSSRDLSARHDGKKGGQQNQGRKRFEDSDGG